jgi:hypothetical protein
LREQLGDEKFREYKRGEDEDYHRLCSTLTRLEMPHQKANEIYDMKRDLMAARETVINNPNFTPERRESVLKVLAQETEQAVHQVLGERGYNVYTQAGYANWMRN